MPEFDHPLVRNLDLYEEQRYRTLRVDRREDTRLKLVWRAINRLFRTSRLSEAPGVGTTIYVDATNGDDSLGDGTSSSPLATIAQALSLIPRDRPGEETYTVSVAAGTYTDDLAGIHTLLDRVSITGTVTDGTAYNISSVGASSEANGNILTLDTPNETYTQDQLRKQRVLFQSGAYGWIYGNAATTGAAGSETTVVYVSYGDDTFATPSTSTTLTFQTLETEIVTTAQHLTLIGCETLAFNDIAFDLQGATKGIFAYRSSRIDLNRCYVSARQVVAGAEGRLQIVTSYLSLKGVSGGFKRWGGVRAADKAVLTLSSGIVVDFASENQAAAGRHIIAQHTGSLEYEGEVVCLGLGTSGILSEGGYVGYVPGTIKQSGTPFFRFALAGDGSTVTCSNGFKFNNLQGVGGYGELRAYGEVASDYMVTSTRNGYVWIDGDTSVTDATGTNTVSADDGSTASSSNADGTLIVGP
jgi:hypothetical protein